MSDSTWNDVAQFVSQYMVSPRASHATSGSHSTDLPLQIAEAYIEARGLPRSALSTVLPIVDSVL